MSDSPNARKSYNKRHDYYRPPSSQKDNVNVVLIDPSGPQNNPQNNPIPIVPPNKFRYQRSSRNKSKKESQNEPKNNHQKETKNNHQNETTIRILNKPQKYYSTQGSKSDSQINTHQVHQGRLSHSDGDLIEPRFSNENPDIRYANGQEPQIGDLRTRDSFREPRPAVNVQGTVLEPPGSIKRNASFSNLSPSSPEFVPDYVEISKPIMNAQEDPTSNVYDSDNPYPEIPYPKIPHFDNSITTKHIEICQQIDLIFYAFVGPPTGNLPYSKTFDGPVAHGIYTEVKMLTS